MANRRMLIAFAHPDDESFGMGGAIARYVAEGVDVYYLCATNGDVGTVAPELLNGYDSVAALRLAELDKASQILGFKEVILLGYKDSGMMHSEFNNDPACLWQAPLEEVTRRLVEVIRRIKPQVVVTFNKYGGYGHPDHIKIQQATVQAFHKAGDASYHTDGLAPYAPQKLYYTTIPTFFIRAALGLMRLRRQDPRKAGRNQDIDIQAILDNVEPTHALVDIRPYFDKQDAASAAHLSQGGGRIFPLQRVLRLFLRGQSFTRVHPHPPHDRVDETDLFAGVRLEDTTGAL
ncbi:MAG: PIG-L family deacetylase [Chloroflexi bacterium]|nr:PIG-L family deacetylase [Chloroflexota bacterium]